MYDGTSHDSFQFACSTQPYAVHVLHVNQSHHICYLKIYTAPKQATPSESA